MVAHSDHGDVTGQAAGVSQLGGDADPALLVKLLFAGVTEHRSCDAALYLATPLHLTDRGPQFVPVRHRVDDHVAVESDGHDQPSFLQECAMFGGQHQSTLGVHRVHERSKEFVLIGVEVLHSVSLLRHCAPPSPTPSTT